MSRIFVAVNVSEPVRRLVESYANHLRHLVTGPAASWVKPENLHLTLRFIGDCTERELDILTALVSEQAKITRSFVLGINGTGVFPDKGRPRILWLGVSDREQALAAIKSSIDTAYGDIAAPPTVKRERFSPHLTIARIKDAEKCRRMIAHHLSSGFESSEFRVAEIVIYESTLNPAGSIYTALSVHPLAID